MSSPLRRLGEAPIGKLLFELSFPAMVGMLVQALYNVIDRLFIGRYCGSNAMAGVSLAFPFMAVLAAFGTLIGVGSSALLSIKLGQRKKAEAEQVVAQCIVLKILLFVTIPFAMLVFLDPLLKAAGATPEAMPDARNYLRIILYCNVFSHLSFGMSSMMRAEGQAKMSMLCMVIGAVLNTILDPIFIFVLKLGVAGAAWATNLAMLATMIFAFSFYLSGKSAVRMRWSRFRIYPAMALRVMEIGLSPFLLQTMMSLITIAYNRMFLKWCGSSAETTLQIAAMGIIGSTLNLLLMPVFGLTQGMQPIVGYNHGAEQFDRVRAAFKLCIIAATIATTAVTVVVMAAANPIIGCFASENDAELIKTGTHWIRIYSCMIFTIGMPIVVVAYYQSIGRAWMSICLSMMRQFVMLLPLIVIFPRWWGLFGIWIAAPVSDLLSAVLTDTFGFRELRALEKKAANRTSAFDSWQK